MIITVIAASVTACGDKAVDSNVSVEGTSAVSQEDTTQAETTKSAEELASEQAELESKADALKASIAAERESAVAAADEAANSAAAAQAASKAAEEASQAEAMLEAAAQVADQKAGASDEVITVVDSYGVESARQQYIANYDVYVELVRLTNELRASLGVAPVTMDENICIASCKKAVDYYLANYYDGENHSMIDGRAWTTLFTDFSISGSAFAENIARGPAYKTAQQMFEGWKNSTVHYTNMVNSKYTRIGVGSCGYVWVMDLAG